jgi:hypothetical protein
MTTSVKRTQVTFIPLIVDIVRQATPTQINANLFVVIDPAETPSQQTNVVYKFNVITNPISINLSQPIIQSAFQYLQTAFSSYVDEDRKLKTLLNYGSDRQTIVLNYRYGAPDSNSINKIQLKLLKPLPDEISEGTAVFLSREVAKTLIDKVRVRFAPPLDTTPYLRPKNINTSNVLSTGKTVQNITLQQLNLTSGSTGLSDQYQNKTFEDQIFRQWYSYDFNSAELNIDFTDYSKFVFYGSAAMRLAAFKEKLAKLERLENNRIQFLSSSTYTMSNNLVGAIFVQEKTAQYATEKEDIIRGFDRYEQYLYFTPSGSVSPYSASVFYVDGGTEYNPIGYWPKNTSGSLYLTYDPIATEWFESQSIIAQRFDEFNENNLINTIPVHVREHDDNAAYITFVSMIGHFFDTIKPYVDQFPAIYSRNLNPNKELSKDLVNEIVESIGFKLPTVNSVYDLTNNILGTENDQPRRDLTAEIYKRILHNLPFYTKAKGTKTSLESFIRTFGITPQLLSVRETGTPVSSSYYVFDEYSTGLKFTDAKTSYIRLPISASARNPKTLQFNLSLANDDTMTVLTGDDLWAMNINRHPSITNLGRIEILDSSSAVLISSSYYPLYTGELFNITLQNTQQTSSLYLSQTEGEDLVFRNINTNYGTFNSLWNNTQYVYFGGAGPRVTSRFYGKLDELRLWSDSLSDETILNATFDPASNAGDTYESAVDSLLVQLSFNNITSTSLTSSSIKNESPYKNKNVSPLLDSLFLFNISGSDFVRYNRSVRQNMIIAGSTGQLINKIKVAPDPIFMDGTLPYKRLYRTQSIVQPDKKRLQVGRNKIILAMSPTDIINQNIIRNFGYENLNSVIGLPNTTYNLFETSLNSLKTYYQRYYYVDVNFNKFIRIMSEFSSIIGQVVDYFIPSKATLLKGILIEQNLLEQVRIPPIKNISLYGKNSRKTLKAAGSLSSSKSEYGATFNVSDTIEVLPPLPIGKYTTYKQSQDNKLITSGSFVAKAIKHSTTLDTTPFISGSTSKLTVNLKETFKDIEASIAQYTTTVEKYLQEITASLPTLKTQIELDIVNTTGSYNSYKTMIQEVPLPTLNGGYTYFTGSAGNIYQKFITASYNTYNIKHEEWNSKIYWHIEQYGSSSVFKPRPSSTDTGVSNLNKISYNSNNFGLSGAEPYGRVYPRKLFTSEINTPRIAGNTSLYVPALYDIPPVADFRDFGVYTFFSDVEGIYYFPQVVKVPAYSRELNQEWNMDAQEFVSVATWSYGDRYNIHDVVYQNLTGDELQRFGENNRNSIKAGNDRYYVFKTRPNYRPTEDGTSFYSGSVPSYTPPALDNNNWELLRFTPIQKRIPKRVVFDTYTISSPALNNFKTTTLPLETIIDVPDRYVDSFDIPSINASSYIMGELSVQNIAALFAIQMTVAGLRLRLYRTSEAAMQDLDRPIESRPSGSHGVLLDIPITNSNTLEVTNPISLLVADSSPPAGKIYYTINNLDTTNKLGLKLLMYYFAIQIEPRIPQGYLRKHYRFFRDNSTGTKRRNYEGCKNTQGTTIDGLPPVQVFLSEGTDLVISPTQTNDEIITGGGGTLNVT